MRSRVDLSVPSRLAATGRFREALYYLEPLVRSQGGPVIEELTLLTEILENCGLYDRAEVSATAVCDDARADASSRARVLISIARMRFFGGLDEQAHRYFAEAKRLALEADDVTLLCQVVLGQLGTVSDLYSAPALAAQVDEARRYVLRSGDDSLLARFQCYLARF